MGGVLGRMLGHVLGEAGGLALKVLGAALLLALLALLLSGTDTFGVLGSMLMTMLPWLVLVGLLPALGFLLWRLGQIGAWRAGKGEICGRCGGLAVVRVWKPEGNLRCLACGGRKRRREDVLELRKGG